MSNVSNPHYNVVLDRKKYKGDSLPYTLVLLGLVLNVLYFVSVYRLNDGIFYQPVIGASVIYNLLFMLSVFLCAENLKNYKWKFSIVIIGIGLLQIARLFVIPPMLAKITSSKYTKDQLSAVHFRMHLYLIGSCVLLVLGSVWSIINSLRLQEYKELTDPQE